MTDQLDASASKIMGGSVVGPDLQGLPNITVDKLADYLTDEQTTTLYGDPEQFGLTLR